MDAWKPKYKALHDTIDTIRDTLKLLAIAAVLVVIFMLTI